MENLTIIQTGRNEFRKIVFNKVLYLQADGNYTHIKLKDNKKITICKSLKQTAKEMFDKKEFIKIKRNIIINTNCIESIKKGKKCIITLENGEQITTSTRFKVKSIMFVK